MKEVKLPKYFVIKQCNRPLWNDYIEWLNKTYSVNYGGATSDYYYGYDGNGRFNGTNNWDTLHKFENNPEIITLEYWNQCINQPKNKTQMTQKLTVKVTEVLKIHEIACSSWKATISSYLSRMDKDQNITFFPVEIKEMFKASNQNQLPVLEEVFGKEEVVIEYDRLQTGSIVKLHPNKKGQAINGTGTGKMNLDKAVNIVFANTPHSIDYLGKFVKKCYYDSYYTFEQDGIFARYSTNELDYIAEVIEY